MFVSKLVDIFNRYNNTYHTTTKIKPVDVQSSKYINCAAENSDKDPKFEAGDRVKISKCKSIFPIYPPN